MVSALNGTDDVIVGIDGFVEIDYAIWRSEYWSAIEFYLNFDENFQTHSYSRVPKTWQLSLWIHVIKLRKLYYDISTRNQLFSTETNQKYLRFGFILYPCLRISSTTWFALYVPSVCFWYITIYIYYLVYDRAQTLCRLWYVIFKWKLYRRAQVCSRIHSKRP